MSLIQLTKTISKKPGDTAELRTGAGYVLKADGSAMRVGNLKKPPYLERGDTVIVPEKIQVVSDLRMTRDIVDIVYKTAISAAVVVDAFD